MFIGKTIKVVVFDSIQFGVVKGVDDLRQIILENEDGLSIINIGDIIC